MEEDIIHRDRDAQHAYDAPNPKNPELLKTLVEGEPPKRKRPETSAKPTPEQEKADKEAQEKKDSLASIKRDLDALSLDISRDLAFEDTSPEALQQFENRLDDLRSQHESTQKSTREQRAKFFAEIEKSLQNFEAEVQKPHAPREIPQVEKAAPTLSPRKGGARSRITRTQTPATSLAGGISIAGTPRYERVSPPTRFEADTLSEKDVAERAEQVALGIYADLLSLETEKLQSLLERATPEEKAAVQNPDLLDDIQSRTYVRAMKKAHDVLDDLEERGRPIPKLVEEDPYPRSVVERSALGTERVMGLEVPQSPRVAVRRTPQRAQSMNDARRESFDSDISADLISLPSNEVASWAQESLGITDVENFFTKYESLSQDDERREDLLSQEAQAFLATHDAQDVIALMQTGMETSPQKTGFFGRIKNLFSQSAREVKVLERVVREFDDLLLEAVPRSGRAPKSKRPSNRRSAQDASSIAGITK